MPSAQSAFVILSKLSVRMGCPWSVRRRLLLWMLTYCRALYIYYGIVIAFEGILVFDTEVPSGLVPQFLKLNLN